ncbi:hypothetical protein G6F23_012633 [Rhizopus arrhizus]|nr:hypothetical protein G6F23_012633 [Rhizopus arrhizus]
MFAQLPSGSELRPHRDPFAGSLRLHLGLATPNNDGCYIEVDGIKKSWRDGEWMMFDETYIHHAHNETPDDRVILFCDIARPLHFGLPGLCNRAGAATLRAGGAAPNLPGDPTGGVNKAFGSVYKVRLKAKALRERSVVAYQLIKWGLVVAVIFVFLRRLWATIIPSVAVPLSLAGTFAVMAFAGMSLDNLSLMALVVATGFVVDDAIVMIENIVRYIEQGKSGKEAAEIGARQIGFTVLSLTVSLVAVFLPLLLMPGVTGRLFHEFAWVLSIAVVLSMLISLTLTPMMCAYLLKPDALPEGEDAHERAAAAGKQNLWTRTVGLACCPSRTPA